MYGYGYPSCGYQGYYNESGNNWWWIIIIIFIIFFIFCGNNWNYRNCN